ncbi:Cna B-type domain-containing protein [Erysipelothrix rhusiopathiae]|nr:Cna B-type domain-containing protein [Erysipelothrix rhusiopathiae]
MFKKKHYFMVFILMTGLILNILGAASVRNVYADNRYITKMTITDSKGKPLSNINQWTDVQLNFEFELPNNTVKKGDTTLIQLPKSLRLLKDQEFNIENKKGDVIAVAKVDAQTKTILMTYTDYPEHHSDVSGGLFVNVRIDTQTITEKQSVPIWIDIDGQSYFVGDLEYEKVGDNPSEKFTKYAWFNNDNGTELRYVLRINGSAATYNDVHVEDSLKSPGLRYDVSSFKITQGIWRVNDAGSFVLDESRDVTDKFQILINEDATQFSVDFGDIDKVGYRIDYKVLSNHDALNGELFENYAVMKANKEIIRERDTELTFQTSGGYANGYHYTIRILKKNESGTPLAGAKFDVIRDSVGQSVGTITTDETGIGVLTGLLKDHYTIKELEAPKGYMRLDKELRITENDFDGTKEYYTEIINKRFIDTISISGEKIWDDDYNRDGIRPDQIAVRLRANGADTTYKQFVSAETNWKYTFLNIPKLDDAGNEIVYTVHEDAVPGYDSVVEGLTITNRHNPEQIEIKGKKYWHFDTKSEAVSPNTQPFNQSVVPSEITVNLYANGTKIESKTVTKDQGWAYQFPNLPKFLDGKEILYSIDEDEVAGFDLTVDGFDLHNRYQSNTISHQVLKVWDDDNNRDGLRPLSIQVQLYANQVPYGNPVNLDESMQWMFTWSDLPRFDSNGVIVDYHVQEVSEVLGYQSSSVLENGTKSILTNTHVLETISIQGQKLWNDQNRETMRPNSISIRLYADGVHVQSKDVYANDGWKYSFDMLPKYKEGKRIRYTVDELPIQNYQSTVDGFDITNHYQHQSKTKTLPQTGISDNHIGSIFVFLGMALMAIKNRE